MLSIRNWSVALVVLLLSSASAFAQTITVTIDTTNLKVRKDSPTSVSGTVTASSTVVNNPTTVVVTIMDSATPANSSTVNINLTNPSFLPSGATYWSFSGTVPSASFVPGPGTVTATSKNTDMPPISGTTSANVTILDVK